MARNQVYRVLLMTSLEDVVEPITEMTRGHFANVETLFWEIGDKETKAAAVEQLDASDQNLIISYLNGIILRRHHLDQATFGAVNIHPYPPEHPGLWGGFCQPVIRRGIRTHHGTTMHEIDEEIDHGPIYAVERWDVSESDTIEFVMERSFEDCMKMFEFTVKQLAAGSNGSKCFTPLDEHWDVDNGHHGVADIQAWFRDLDPAHPAHQERIFFNHPNGMMAPPYFTDLVE